jgi:threonyl-tRNA synthetase
MNSKIRAAQLDKIPYMLVVGDREAEAGAVALRLRNGEDAGAVPVDAFIETASGIVRSKSAENWQA